jgi:signal transduction histidine kinase
MYYMSKDREKGTGLGLFLVKEALQKLGGEIEVKSEKGEGSTFSVILKK